MQSKETVNRTWYVIDAKDIPLGRVASKAAVILRGKHKVTYTPHVDCGDYVIIVNADKVALTGNKLEDKIYYDHSRYVGGLRERTVTMIHERKCGRYDIVCTTFFPPFDAISLSKIANAMAVTKVTTRLITPIASVFLITRINVISENSILNLSNPTNAE